MNRFVVASESFGDDCRTVLSHLVEEINARRLLPFRLRSPDKLKVTFEFLFRVNGPAGKNRRFQLIDCTNVARVLTEPRRSADMPSNAGLLFENRWIHSVYNVYVHLPGDHYHRFALCQKGSGSGKNIIARRQLVELMEGKAHYLLKCKEDVLCAAYQRDIAKLQREALDIMHEGCVI